jgi:cyclopropane fatty-acyl-phospholipid synthase-like methyltransferase
MELSTAFIPAEVVLTANSLGLFEALKEGGLEAGEIARRLETEPQATRTLLDALVVLKLLKKDKGIYTNAPAAKDLLTSNSPYYLGQTLLHCAQLKERWARLEEAVRKGRLAEKEKMATAWCEEFVLGMAGMAKFLAPTLARLVNLKGASALLDLGGGLGTYGLEFARRYQGLKVIIYDLPQVVKLAREALDLSEFEGRVKFVGGDYLEQDLPRGFDAALLSNVIHQSSAEEVRLILLKVFKALNSDGLLILKDFLLNEARTAPAYAALFSLNMLVSTQRGRTYTRNEARKLLQEAGFSVIKSHGLKDSSTVLLAKKTHLPAVPTRLPSDTTGIR